MHLHYTIGGWFVTSVIILLAIRSLLIRQKHFTNMQKIPKETFLVIFMRSSLQYALCNASFSCSLAM